LNQINYDGELNTDVTSNWRIKIENYSHVIKLIQYPKRLYKALLIHPGRERKTQAFTAIDAHLAFPSWVSARTELMRAGLQNLVQLWHLHGSFWGTQLCATARLYVRLFPSGVRYCTTTSYYFQKDVCGTALLPFFLHELTIDYLKQLNMSTVGDGTAGASGNNLKLSRFFIVFVLFLNRLSTNMNNHYAAIILLILNNSMIFLLILELKCTVKCLNI
jgi:hypothetical protein